MEQAVNSRKNKVFNLEALINNLLIQQDNLLIVKSSVKFLRKN